MEDKTIMPDGRPLFAWRNEIEMNRSQRIHDENKRKELNNLMTLLNVLEIEQKKEPHTGDYLFRVRRKDIVQSFGATEAIEKAEVTRI